MELTRIVAMSKSLLAVSLLLCAQAAGRAQVDAVPAESSEAIKNGGMPIPDLVEQVSDSVMLLRTFDGRGDKLGVGTGFVVRGDGVVVTNYHVIKGASKLEAKTSDEATLFCTGVITFDEDRDIALLKLNAKNLPALVLADPDDVRIGEPVVAIGSPLGLEHSVSNGIVSAKRRDGDTDLFQVTSPISPGSSGSPLLRSNGEVLAMASFHAAAGHSVNFGVSSVHIANLLRVADKIEPTPLSIAVGVMPEASEGDQSVARPELPVPVVSDDADQDPRVKRLDVFWRSYWRSLSGNDGEYWAAHFTDPSDYQYLKGQRASRKYVASDRNNLINRYPDRRYILTSDPVVIPLNSAGDRIGFDFEYDYYYRGDSRAASGTSKTELALKWVDGLWLVYKFRETVDRD